MHTLILKRLPRSARKPTLVAARVTAALSLLLWLAMGFPWLSQVGAAALVYVTVLALPALIWRRARKTVRKAALRKRRR